MTNYLEEVLSEEAALTLETHLPLSVRPRDGKDAEDETDVLSPDHRAEPSGPLSSPGTAVWEGDAGEQRDGAAAVLDEVLSEGRRTQPLTAHPQPNRTADVLLHALTEARRTTQAAFSPYANAIPLTFREHPTSPQSQALLDWDRAVQRDARRYDGGFPLY